MTLDPKAEAATALHRFGVGPRAGSIAAIASDPRGALLAELDKPAVGRIANPDLLASGPAARAAFEFQRARRAERQAQRSAQQGAPPQGAAQQGAAPEMTRSADAAPAAPPAQPPRQQQGPGVPQQIYLDEA